MENFLIENNKLSIKTTKNPTHVFINGNEYVLLQKPKIPEPKKQEVITKHVEIKEPIFVDIDSSIKRIGYVNNNPTILVNNTLIDMLKYEKVDFDYNHEIILFIANQYYASTFDKRLLAQCEKNAKKVIIVVTENRQELYPTSLDFSNYVSNFVGVVTFALYCGEIVKSSSYNSMTELDRLINANIK